MNRWLVISLLATGLALAVSGYVDLNRETVLPDPVPIHWNAKFEVDGWVPRAKFWPVLWGMPAVMAALCGMTVLLPRISPRRFAIETFQGTYFYVMGLVVLLMGYLHLAILWGTVYSQDHKTGFMKAFLGGMCLFFVLLGNVLGKVRRNFWMGVRTPWTIASETVWNRTHRLAAWLFVAAGLVSLGLVLLLPASASVVVVIGLVASIGAAALIPVVYSAVLYKRLERAGQLDVADLP